MASMKIKEVGLCLKRGVQNEIILGETCTEIILGGTCLKCPSLEIILVLILSRVYHVVLQCQTFIMKKNNVEDI